MTDGQDLDVGQGSWTIDDFLSDYRPVAQSVHLTARGDLLAELTDLEKRAAAARDLQSEGLDDYGASELEEQADRVRDELHASMRRFTVVSIGDRAWADLIAAHPATDEDKERNRFVPWHPDTFWPAAYVKCVSQPQLDASSAAKLAEAVDSGQMQKLRDAILEVNGGGADIPKSGRSSERTRNSKRNSRT